jgi:hypothetical protein
VNKSDIATIIGIIRTAYPQYYKDKNSIIDTTELWYEIFQGDDINAIKVAVKSYIANNTSGFPPSIGEIKNELYKLYKGDEKSDVELWNELKSALRNGIYYADEIFPNLSKELQQFLGNPASLKELAMMDIEQIDTVQKGIFLKQLPIIKQREKEKQMMLPDRREMIEKLANKWDIKRLEGER